MGVNSIGLTSMDSTDLATIDNALAKVDSAPSTLGAAQNRFASVETNLSASRSRIQEADYATEVSNMSRAQILQQAGTSVLARPTRPHRTSCRCIAIKATRADKPNSNKAFKLIVAT